MTYYSQNGEDYLLERIFPGDHGLFVEVGCIDGRRFSNTLRFEEKGWKGLCVEAHADYIEALRKNRPGSIVCHCAAAETDEDDVPFFANARGSLSTLDRSSEADFERRFGQWFTGFEEQRVPKRRLDTLFDQFGIADIDILSIDVEGYEAQTLRGIDFERFRPTVLVLEAETAEAEAAIAALLEPAGYHKSSRLASNLFFLADPDLAERIEGVDEEVRLTHTGHPLDREPDRAVTVRVDTRPPRRLRRVRTVLRRLGGWVESRIRSLAALVSGDSAS